MRAHQVLARSPMTNPQRLTMSYSNSGKKSQSFGEHNRNGYSRPPVLEKEVNLDVSDSTSPKIRSYGRFTRTRSQYKSNGKFAQNMDRLDKSVLVYPSSPGKSRQQQARDLIVKKYRKGWKNGNVSPISGTGQLESGIEQIPRSALELQNSANQVCPEDIKDSLQQKYVTVRCSPLTLRGSPYKTTQQQQASTQVLRKYRKQRWCGYAMSPLRSSSMGIKNCFLKLVPLRLAARRQGRKPVTVRRSSRVLIPDTSHAARQLDFTEPDGLVHDSDGVTVNLNSFICISEYSSAHVEDMGKSSEGGMTVTPSLVSKGEDRHDVEDELDSSPLESGESVYDKDTSSPLYSSLASSKQVEQSNSEQTLKKCVPSLNKSLPHNYAITLPRRQSPSQTVRHKVLVKYKQLTSRTRKRYKSKFGKRSLREKEVCPDSSDHIPSLHTNQCVVGTATELMGVIRSNGTTSASHNTVSCNKDSPQPSSHLVNGMEQNLSAEENLSLVEGESCEGESDYLASHVSGVAMETGSNVAENSSENVLSPNSIQTSDVADYDKGAFLSEFEKFLSQHHDGGESQKKAIGRKKRKKRGRPKKQPATTVQLAIASETPDQELSSVALSPLEDSSTVPVLLSPEVDSLPPVLHAARRKRRRAWTTDQDWKPKNWEQVASGPCSAVASDPSMPDLLDTTASVEMHSPRKKRSRAGLGRTSFCPCCVIPPPGKKRRKIHHSHLRRKSQDLADRKFVSHMQQLTSLRSKVYQLFQCLFPKCAQLLQGVGADTDKLDLLVDEVICVLGLSSDNGTDFKTEDLHPTVRQSVSATGDTSIVMTGETTCSKQLEIDSLLSDDHTHDSGYFEGQRQLSMNISGISPRSFSVTGISPRSCLEDKLTDSPASCGIHSGSPDPKSVDPPELSDDCDHPPHLLAYSVDDQDSLVKNLEQSLQSGASNAMYADAVCKTDLPCNCSVKNCCCRLECLDHGDIVTASSTCSEDETCDNKECCSGTSDNDPHVPGSKNSTTTSTSSSHFSCHFSNRMPDRHSLDDVCCGRNGPPIITGDEMPALCRQELFLDTHGDDSKVLPDIADTALRSQAPENETLFVTDDIVHQFSHEVCVNINMSSSTNSIGHLVAGEAPDHPGQRQVILDLSYPFVSVCRDPHKCLDRLQKRIATLLHGLLPELSFANNFYTHADSIEYLIELMIECNQAPGDAQKTKVKDSGV